MKKMDFEGGAKMGKKELLSKKLSNGLTKIANRTAIKSLDDACILFIYQPKLPKSLKKKKA